MYEELVKRMRQQHQDMDCGNCNTCVIPKVADAIEELSKRIGRAVELYNRGVERSAMYEALVGIAPEPPKEEA